MVLILAPQDGGDGVGGHSGQAVGTAVGLLGDELPTDDNEVYDMVFGEFYEAYMAAKEEADPGLSSPRAIRASILMASARRMPL